MLATSAEVNACNHSTLETDARGSWIQNYLVLYYPICLFTQNCWIYIKWLSFYLYPYLLRVMLHWLLEKTNMSQIFPLLWYWLFIFFNLWFNCNNSEVFAWSVHIFFFCIDFRSARKCLRIQVSFCQTSFFAALMVALFLIDLLAHL